MKPALARCFFTRSLFRFPGEIHKTNNNHLMEITNLSFLKTLAVVAVVSLLAPQTAGAQTDPLGLSGVTEFGYLAPVSSPETLNKDAAESTPGNLAIVWIGDNEDKGRLYRGAEGTEMAINDISWANWSPDNGSTSGE